MFGDQEGFLDGNALSVAVGRDKRTGERVVVAQIHPIITGGLVGSVVTGGVFVPVGMRFVPDLCVVLN